MKKICLLIFAACFSCKVFSQQFWHQYTPTSYAYNASVLTPDGGLMIVSNAIDSSWMMPRIFRIDPEGNIDWAIQLKVFPDFNRGRFVDIIHTYDSCYLTIGQMYSGNTYNGILMHKFDQNGSALWTKLFYPLTCGGITGSYESHCVIEAKDKGFAVSGSCGAPGGEGMFLFKTDSAGNPEWFKAYYDFHDLNFWYRNLCQDNDSGFVFFNQYASLNQDGLIIHTDKSGNLLMSATLDSMNTSSLNALFNIDGQVYLCFENGFVKSALDTMAFWLPTYTFPYGSYQFKTMEKCMNSDLILAWNNQGGAFGMLRTDSNGIPVWARANVSGQLAGEFYERPDGQFMYQGTYAYAQSTTTEVILFDSTGNMDCFAGPTTVTRDSVLERLRYAPVNQSTCTLTYYVPPMHWQDLGTMTDVCIGASVASHAFSDVEVFPNPGTGKFQVNGLSDVTSLEVVDLKGRQITKKEIQEKSVSIDLSGYQKGVYAIRLIKNGIPVVCKIVLQ